MVVAAAGQVESRDPSGAAHCRRALEDLIRIYWFPLYAFVRRRGEPAHAAEDVVQGFFTCLMEKEYLAQVDRSRGRFRTFLLTAIQHYLSKERDKARAKKRGGGRKIIPLTAGDAEARYSIEPADEMTPQRLFERQWALTLLAQVLEGLREEYARAGKAELYAALEPCLTGEGIDYGPAAGQLGMTPPSLRVAAHRFRQRYRDRLKAEIAQTVDTPQQVEEEIAYLLNCL